MEKCCPLELTGGGGEINKGYRNDVSLLLLLQLLLLLSELITASIPGRTGPSQTESRARPSRSREWDNSVVDRDERADFGKLFLAANLGLAVCPKTTTTFRRHR